MADEQDNEAPASSPEGEGENADASQAVDAEQTAASSPEGEPTVAAEQADADAGSDADAGEDASSPASSPVGEGEPVVQVPPKERRRRARSKHTEARPSRSPEERHAERVTERKVKAARRRARRLQERAKAATRRAGAPAPAPLAPVHAPVEGKRKVRQGVVVSDKAQKTITVRIDVARRHRRYEKIVRSSSTLHAHDENNDAHEGDVVRVIESRPLSRSKRWTLVDVVERAR